MAQCVFRHAPDDGPAAGRCPRSALSGWDRCPFHLSPGERSEAGVDGGDLRAAFLADVRSGADRRKELAGARFDDLDLSSLVLDGEDRGRIVLRDVTVGGRLDLTAAVVSHPLDLWGCSVGHLDLTDATVEGAASITGGTFGAEGGSGTCLTARRAAFEAGLHVTGTVFEGGVEFPACTVEGWLDVEDATVRGRMHFPRATVAMAQFIDATVEAPAEFAGADVGHLAIDRGTYASPLDLSGADLDDVRFRPGSDLTVDLVGATVAEGRLDQPPDGRVLYDLAEATVGDVDLDCTPATFDRYRFYRTAFESFPFAAYRDLLRDNGWRIHEYAGEADADIEDLEITYLKAKQGAIGVGDNESAAAFFIHEMRYRRGRYAAHLRDHSYGISHRIGAAIRWTTNAFLGFLSGYGERPGRVLLASLAVIVGAGLVYPAVGIETANGTVLAYDGAGPEVVLDGLYFSVVVFTTLGLGDVTPTGGIGRVIVGTEALVGAFLTALFVFTLGRSVAR